MLYSPRMFARKLHVEIIEDGKARPCPLDWLDSFAMRNFTGSAEFDDTLPIADGELEAGLSVEPARLARALQDFLNKRGKGNGHDLEVTIREIKTAEI
jgi:hypothetical protein